MVKRDHAVSMGFDKDFVLCVSKEDPKYVWRAVPADKVAGVKGIDWIM